MLRDRIFKNIGLNKSKIDNFDLSYYNYISKKILRYFIKRLYY